MYMLLIDVGGRDLHLTWDNRLTIQEGLKQGLSHKAIEELILKSPITVSCEIKNHMRVKNNARAEFVMKEKTQGFDYLKFPFFCDNCGKKKGCLSGFYEYTRRSANLPYLYTLKLSRTGINCERLMCQFNVRLLKSLF